MVALESECLRDNGTTKLIASKELDIALDSLLLTTDSLPMQTECRLRTLSVSDSACRSLI